jgi:hypothetical protein
MKNYCLKVNEHSLYFKSLEDVKKWFKTCDVKTKLKLEDGYSLSLNNLEEIVGEGEVMIYNESMLERGDDYCTIELEEFSFEFQNN